MADPFRTLAKKSLTNAIAGITPDDGYLSDLQPYTADDGQPMDRVYRGRAWFGSSDPLPMVAILERPDYADELAAPPDTAMRKSYDWHLIIQGFAPDEGNNPTDAADAMLTDVKLCLARERQRRHTSTRRLDPLGLGNNGARKNFVESLSFDHGVVRPADEISAKAYFWLNVTLRIIEDPLFPFD